MCNFTKVRGHVCSIDRTSGTSSFRVESEDRTTFVADDVVLALGNPPPANLPETRSLQASPRYIADPWSVPASFKPNESVLVIGTGLTMADTVIAGDETAAGAATFHAISRHGMVPPTQTAFRHAGCDGNDGPLLRAASLSARRLFRAVRELTHDVQSRGGDWREAITRVRTLAPSLWQRLPTKERKRFLRHARPYWDVHRHRLPTQTLAKLNEMQRQSKLHVHAGRISGFELVGDKIRVSWRARGGAAPQTLLVDRVVNCTGADYNPARSQDPLIRALLKSGVIASDALGLGRVPQPRCRHRFAQSRRQQPLLHRPHATSRLLGMYGRPRATRSRRTVGTSSRHPHGQSTHTARPSDRSRASEHHTLAT